ncbi:hypothetical protein MKX01_021174, partial [Papaver californicum]
SIDGEAGMSHEASQREYPCYSPEVASDHEPTTTSTTTWRNDTMTMEPLCYTRPMNFNLSVYPSLIFNNASDVIAPTKQPVMSMSSFNL